MTAQSLLEPTVNETSQEVGHDISPNNQDMRFLYNEKVAIAKTRWLKVSELEYLLNPETTPLPLSTQSLRGHPPSGTLLLFDRTITRNYKSDDHDWIKKRNSKKIREDHVKLRLHGENRVAGFYAHSQSHNTLHRRAYHLLDPGSSCGGSNGKLNTNSSNLVLLHYLDTDVAATIIVSEHQLGSSYVNRDDGSRTHLSLGSNNSNKRMRIDQHVDLVARPYTGIVVGKKKTGDDTTLAKSYWQNGATLGGTRMPTKTPTLRQSFLPQLTGQGLTNNINYNALLPGGTSGSSSPQVHDLLSMTLRRTLAARTHTPILTSSNVLSLLTQSRRESNNIANSIVATRDANETAATMPPTITSSDVWDLLESGVPPRSYATLVETTNNNVSTVTNDAMPDLLPSAVTAAPMNRMSHAVARSTTMNNNDATPDSSPSSAATTTTPKPHGESSSSSWRSDFNILWEYLVQEVTTTDDSVNNTSDS